MVYFRVLSFIIFVLFFLSHSVLANAAQNFKTDLSATYTINESDSANVVIDLTLTNSSENHFPDSYQLYLSFDDVSDVKAEDGGGRIESAIEKTSKGQILNLALNKKPIGLNKKTNIKISFSTKSILRRTPSAVEINIPGISDADTFGKFDLYIKVPESFGEPSYIKPFSSDLSYSKDEISKSGISVAFGESQTYEYSLAYHLKNPNFYPKNVTLALPPTTNYQEIFINYISPRPKSVILDRDGNWIAAYSLPPLSEQDVDVRGFAKVSLKPDISEISDEEKALYTKSTRFWQSDDENIKKLAQELKTPEKIYHYTVNKLNYDYDRVSKKKPRLGAVASLKNSESAVCLEFTDLFIALARSANIPAREINGFAFTNNDQARPSSLIADVLHAWPEYYDKEKSAWIMVDPTWGNTTGGVDYFSIMDLNHIAFVIKGVRGDFPIPAGGYKSKSEEGVRDVVVNLAESTPEEVSDVDIDVSYSASFIAGLPIKANINIYNKGNKAILPQSLVVSSGDLTPTNQASQIPLIPPFGKIAIEINFENKNILTNKEAGFTIAYASEKQEQEVKIVPFFKSVKGGVLIGVSTIIIFIIASATRRLRLFR